MSFWRDGRDMKAELKANIDKGYDSKRALSEAMEHIRMREVEEPRKRRTSLKKTFVISAIFGAVWQSLRRR